MAQEQISNMFDNTLAPNNDITKYTLMRGVPDYTQLAQWDMYETGYGFLIVLQIPVFLDKAKSYNTEYENMIRTYRHILEYEFKGLQGIEDLTSETNEITNGIRGLQMITRVTEQGGTNFQFEYLERNGLTLTKVHELYLRGIKDPSTQVKRYLGMLKGRQGRSGVNNIMTGAGFKYETFHFLAIVTDNTALDVEKAYILASAQPSSAPTQITNFTMGEINFASVQLGFNAFPIVGRVVNSKAVDFLDYINDMTCFDEMNLKYDIFNEQKNNFSPDTVDPDPAVSATFDNSKGTYNK